MGLPVPFGLTRGDDVVHAGHHLSAHEVGRPAQHRAVVHLGAGRVREEAGGALQGHNHKRVRSL